MVRNRYTVVMRSHVSSAQLVAVFRRRELVAVEESPIHVGVDVDSPH